MAPEAFPAGQPVQLVEPVEEAYWPCAQLLQIPAPKLEKLPAAHVPVTADEVHDDPAGQRVQELDNEASVYCPTAHTLQTPAPLDEYLPAGHGPVTATGEQEKPAGHAVHDISPAAE